MRLDHVQLTIPKGTEDEARAFYAGVLGLEEVEKPEELRGRGGVWFALENAQLHLGIEEPGPESRRHLGLLVEDLDGIRGRLEAAGYALDPAATVEGIERFYTRDPFGNKLELFRYE